MKQSTMKQSTMKQSTMKTNTDNQVPVVTTILGVDTEVGHASTIVEAVRLVYPKIDPLLAHHFGGYFTKDFGTGYYFVD